MQITGLGVGFRADIKGLFATEAEKCMSKSIKKVGFAPEGERLKKGSSVIRTAIGVASYLGMKDLHAGNISFINDLIKVSILEAIDRSVCKIYKDVVKNEADTTYVVSAITAGFLGIYDVFGDNFVKKSINDLRGEIEEIIKNHLLKGPLTPEIMMEVSNGIFNKYITRFNPGWRDGFLNFLENLPQPGLSSGSFNPWEGHKKGSSVLEIWNKVHEGEDEIGRTLS